MSELVVATPRLDLVAPTLALLDAELSSAARLGQALGASVASDWPPGEHDRGAVEFFRSQLLSGRDPAWSAWYAVLRAERCLVASAGYFGPPDREGRVEIGYSVSSHFRRRGLAREIVDALVARAFAAGVERVFATCSDDNEASMRLLEQAGFASTQSTRPGRLILTKAACSR